MRTADFKLLLKIAKQHMDKKSNMSVLNNAAFVLRNGSLRLETTNLNVGFRSNTLMTDSAPNATWLCNMGTLMDLSKAHKEDEISFTIQDNGLNIGGMVNILQDNDNWPQWDVGSTGDTHLIDPEALQRVVPAMSNDENKTSLCGVHLNADHTAATDGHRLHVVNILYEGPEVTIPAKLVNVLTECEHIAISGKFNAADRMWTKTEHGEHYFRKVQSAFPNYMQFIPKEFNSFIEHDRADLLNKLEGMIPFVNKKSKTIRIQDGVIEPVFNKDDIFTPKKELVSRQKGGQVLLSIDFLIDTIRSLDTSVVTIKYYSENGQTLKPTLIQGNGLQAVIMPKRG